MGKQHTPCIVAGVILLNTLLSSASCRFTSPPKLEEPPALAVSAPVKRILPPLPSSPLTMQTEKMRARAMMTAAKFRELDFTNDVGMVELSGWDYGARTGEMAELLGGDDLRAFGKLAVAGGMLPEDTDLASLASVFTAVSTGATYSPLDKQIILVDKFSGDSLLTHEFVHALQDQHFDLLKLLLRRPIDFDRMEALFAVIEGDAMNVQHRAEEGASYQLRTYDERIFGPDKSGRRESPPFPPLLTEAFRFRYIDGERFVETVRKARGQHAVDDLFLQPPGSSQQILHPEKYFAKEAGLDVKIDENVLESHSWNLLTSTSIGEIGVRGMLLSGNRERDAFRVAGEWRGDRAFLFERSGTRPLFIWKMAWSGKAAAMEFLSRYSGTRLPRGGSNKLNEPNKDFWEVSDGGGGLVLATRDGEQLLLLRGTASDVREAFELLSSKGPVS